MENTKIPPAVVNYRCDFPP